MTSQDILGRANVYSSIMNIQPVSPWINVFLTALSAGTTTAVAIYVAKISKRQWRTNHEKLRLDLYVRRFDIYLRVLPLQRELLLWEGTSDQLALLGPFDKAFRESRFLFPKSSGVYTLLDEFHKRAFKIVHFENLKPQLQTLGVEEGLEYVNERTENVNWIAGSLEKLEDMMAPFLNFHSA